MADHHENTGPLEVGAAMDYSEHEKTYQRFLTLAKYSSLVCLALLAAMAFGFFTNAGFFEVAEECSGVNFLIAMLAYAVFAAHLCFKSWTRRIVFIAAALATTILANALRAWGTMLAAEMRPSPTAAKSADTSPWCNSAAMVDSA